MWPVFGRRQHNQASTSARCQIDALPSCTGAGKLPGWASISLRMFCRDTPTISSTSDNPTRSGATSINLTDGTALRTSAKALRTAASALSASRVSSNASRPG